MQRIERLDVVKKMVAINVLKVPQNFVLHTEEVEDVPFKAVKKERVTNFSVLRMEAANVAQQLVVPNLQLVDLRYAQLMEEANVVNILDAKNRHSLQLIFAYDMVVAERVHTLIVQRYVGSKSLILPSNVFSYILFDYRLRVERQITVRRMVAGYDAECVNATN